MCEERYAMVRYFHGRSDQLSSCESAKKLSTLQATKILAESERHERWKEEKDGWIVKAAQSGNFFYTA